MLFRQNSIKNARTRLFTRSPFNKAILSIVIIALEAVTGIRPRLASFYTNIHEFQLTSLYPSVHPYTSIPCLEI